MSEYDHAPWRSLAPDDLRRQFDMRVAVPDGPAYGARHRALSEAARATLHSVRDLRYGPGPRQLLDIFPAARPAAPVVMFWHGGGWRQQSKDDVHYVAGPLVAAGATTILVGYDLHPEASLRRMMAEACEAIAWTMREVAAFGGDPSRLVVAGHSAGAQLAGMALAHDFSGEGLRTSGEGVTRHPVRGALLTSGSFDMGPHGRHERYLDMGLADEQLVRDASPAHNPPLDPSVRIVLAVGAQETAGYLWQTEAFHRLLVARGHDSRVLLCPGDHHFSVVGRLAEPDHPLTRALIGLAQAESALPARAENGGPRPRATAP